jgi:hypothetical protein
MLVGCALLGACATTPNRSTSFRYSLDSASASCRHSLTACLALYGKEVASTTAVLKVALDVATRTSIEQTLKDCADTARSEVLLRHRGDFEALMPTTTECDQPAKNAKRKGVTWAMQLGTEMHEVALECIGERLDKLRPGGFLLEQRYRYDSREGRWKRVSREEERLLEETGNRSELLGTLVPDVVIHAGDPLQPQEVYDLKFPCVNPDRVPRWEEYASDHPYAGLTQRDMYKHALDVEPVLVTPRWGAIR